MNVKTRITTGLIFVFFSFSFSSFAQDENKVWNIRECIDYAMENNLTVMNQELNVNINEVNLLQSKMSLLPSLNANGNYGYNWGRSVNPETNVVIRAQQNQGFGSLNLNWTIFSGFKNYNTIKQAKANLEVGQYNLQKSKNDIILSIITFYTNVIFNKELLENALSQLESTTSQMERTAKQVKAGALPVSSLLDLQSQVASSELNVINAENAVSLSELQLKQVMQIPAYQPMEIEIPEIELSEADLTGLNPQRVYEIALATLPEIKSADKSVESSILGVMTAKGSYFPRLSLSAGMNTSYSSFAASRGLFEQTGNFIPTPIGFVAMTGDVVVRDVAEIINVPYATGTQLNDNFGQSLALGISIPIFNNLQVNSTVQRAKIAKDQADVFAEQTRQTLRQNIERAYNDVYSSGKAYQSSLKRVEAQSESFRAMKQRYENGAANATDYELAENNLFQAKSDLLRAKYDFIFKLKILDFYQGKPIDF
jgi:outer membrane protein